MIKIITFCVGIDVLGFPLLHKHILKFKIRAPKDLYIVGFDPYKSDGGGSMTIIKRKTNPITGTIVATYLSRKHLES